MPENPDLDPRLEQHRAEIRENRKRSVIISRSFRQSNPDRPPLGKACDRIEELDRAIRRAIKLISDGEITKAQSVLAKARAPGRYDESHPLSPEAQAFWDSLQEQERLCPVYSLWYDLWLSLPRKYPSLTGEQWHPPEPCQPDKWEETPHKVKQDLLLQYIRWADQNHFLDKASDFLRSLPEETWVEAVPEGRLDLFAESRKLYKDLIAQFALENGWLPELSPQAEELVYFINKKNYICPAPTQWQGLYNLLPKGARTGHIDRTPPIPHILGAWSPSSDPQKKGRFFEHIFWADRYGAIGRIDRFLRTLTPDQWYSR